MTLCEVHAMFEITLLIPEYDNSGEKFGPETSARWEALLADRFGGFSLLPGTTHGGWRGPDGTMYRDRLRGYAVWAVGLACGGKAVEAAREACAIFAQEAVSVRFLGLAEIVSKAV